MFLNKKMKAIEERLAKLEQFEKSVSTICDNYFATNEKHDLSFSTGCSADKFYHFVKSADDRISKFEKALADGELVSKEWHDEQVEHLQEENEELNKEYDSCLIGIEMKLFALDVDITRQNVIENNIFDKGNLIVFIIVEALDIIERKGKHHRHFVCDTVLTFYEHCIFRTDAACHRAIRISRKNNRICRICQFFFHRLLGFTDLHQIAAGNDNAAFINDTDRSADRILHLMNKSLK